MKPIRGASNVNPCPECRHPWFVVHEVHKREWVVECERCKTVYLKPIPESWEPRE